MLVDFIIFLLVVFVIFFCYTILSHVFIRIPYVPTPMSVVREMITMARLKPDDTVYDLGAGDGRLPIAAKRAEPKIRAIGCEFILAVWMLGWCHIKWKQVDIDWCWGDAFKIDLSDADVIFLYLFPSLMKMLKTKFEDELKPGTRIVSHSFKIPGKEPIEEKKVKSYMGETTVRVYVW